MEKEDSVKSYIKAYLNLIDKEEIKLAILEDTDATGSRVLDLVKSHKELIIELNNFVNCRMFYGKDNGIGLTKGSFMQSSFYYQMIKNPLKPLG